MHQAPEPILVYYKHNSCFHPQIAATKHIFSRHYTKFTIFMRKISCFHKEHAAIQNSKVHCPTMHTDSSHGSAHSFTISHQSFGIKAQQVNSSVLDQWMPTLMLFMAEFTRQYFPCSNATENVACHVDGVLWPD